MLFKRSNAKGENIRFVFLEHAAIDPVKIPDFIALYDYALDFTPDQKGPYFTYHFKKNSRQEKLSVTEAIEKILMDIEKMLVLHYNETSRQEN